LRAVNWIHPAHDRKDWWAILDKEMNCLVPEGFLDYLTNNWLFEKNCAPLNYYYY